MQGSHAEKPPAPAMLTKAGRYFWSRTFYTIPLLLPMLTLLFLRILRSKELNLRVGILVWAVGVPVGFFTWLLTWQTFGLGTGQIGATVALIASLSWVLLHRGFYLILTSTRTVPGCVMAGVALIALAVGTFAFESGNAPIRLALIAALVGLSIRLTVRLLAELNKLLMRIFHAIVIPTWRVLNRPVAFR